MILSLKCRPDYKDYNIVTMSTGLSHEANQQKMRILTFMTMGETMKEIPFDLIQKELELQQGEVESFVIDCK